MTVDKILIISLIALIGVVTIIYFYNKNEARS